MVLEPKSLLYNLYHAALLHIEISTEMRTCWANNSVDIATANDRGTMH